MLSETGRYDGYMQFSDERPMRMLTVHEVGFNYATDWATRNNAKEPSGLWSFHSLPTEDAKED